MGIPVAIDTDPGVDDAVALLLALCSPELDVELLSTVAGNVPVSVATRNAKRLVALAASARKPVIARGAARPLGGRLETAVRIHARDGLGGAAHHYPVPAAMPARRDAPRHLVEFVRRHRGEAVVVALGPLTNLARAIEAAPETMRQLRRLVVMGGVIGGPGNMNAVAEFNFHADPLAADAVMTSGLPVELVPLDVTRRVLLSAERIRRFPRNRLATAVKRFTRAGVRQRGGVFMHDPLAVAVAIDPALIETKRFPLRVETRGVHTRGMSVADRRPGAGCAGGGVSVAVDVDAERVLALLDDRLFGSEPGAGSGPRARVVVAGSANVDLSVAVTALPAAGETVLGGDLVQAFGGKGANQAVAARRAGAEVALLARFGRDHFGAAYREFLGGEGINLAAAPSDAGAATGVALITVAADGENQIAVASGANVRLSAADVGAARQLVARAGVLVTQLEVPVETVRSALEVAREFGVTTLHNPAPARPLCDEILRLVDVLVVNEGEAAVLAGVRVDTLAGARRAARALLERVALAAVVTLGRRGLVYASRPGRVPRRIAGHTVRAVDTTGAGDTFVGYLAAAMAAGEALEPALERANLAASRAVTGKGAVSSIPHLEELHSRHPS